MFRQYKSLSNLELDLEVVLLHKTIEHLKEIHKEYLAKSYLASAKESKEDLKHYKHLLFCAKNEMNYRTNDKNA